MKMQKLIEHETSMPTAENFVPISEETRIQSFLFVIAVISCNKPGGGFYVLCFALLPPNIL